MGNRHARVLSYTRIYAEHMNIGLGDKKSRQLSSWNEKNDYKM